VVFGVNVVSEERVVGGQALQKRCRGHRLARIVAVELPGKSRDQASASLMFIAQRLQLPVDFPVSLLGQANKHQVLFLEVVITIGEGACEIDRLSKNSWAPGGRSQLLGCQVELIGVSPVLVCKVSPASSDPPSMIWWRRAVSGARRRRRRYMARGRTVSCFAGRLSHRSVRELAVVLGRPRDLGAKAANRFPISPVAGRRADSHWIEHAILLLDVGAQEV
jgi:hypothetical protein